jgi:hypothetical protein
MLLNDLSTYQRDLLAKGNTTNHFTVEFIKESVPICLRVTNQQPLKRLAWDLTVRSLAKVCRYIPVLLKIGLQKETLYMKE